MLWRVVHANREEEEGEEEDDDYDRGMEAYNEIERRVLYAQRWKRTNRSNSKKKESKKSSKTTTMPLLSKTVLHLVNARSGELVWRRVASDFVADPAELL